MSLEWYSDKGMVSYEWELYGYHDEGEDGDVEEGDMVDGIQEWCGFGWHRGITVGDGRLCRRSAEACGDDDAGPGSK